MIHEPLFVESTTVEPDYTILWAAVAVGLTLAVLLTTIVIAWMFTRTKGLVIKNNPFYGVGQGEEGEEPDPTTVNDHDYCHIYDEPRFDDYSRLGETFALPLLLTGRTVDYVNGPHTAESGPGM